MAVEEAKRKAQEDHLAQKKALRLNEASQYVEDDMPKGIEDRIEKYITKESDQQVKNIMNEYHKLIMTDLSQMKMLNVEKIDKYYTEKGY